VDRRERRGDEVRQQEGPVVVAEAVPLRHKHQKVPRTQNGLAVVIVHRKLEDKGRTALIELADDHVERVRRTFRDVQPHFLEQGTGERLNILRKMAKEGNTQGTFAG
jgi:hypothetical protein